MKTFRTAQPAPYGLYLSLRPVDVHFVGADGETLDGSEGASYVRLPLILAVAAAPVLGGLFVVAFPLLVIVATIVALGRLVSGRVRAAADEHAYLARSGYEPAAAYLNKGEKGEAEEGAQQDDLADLAEEVEARREDETKDQA